MKSAAAYLIFLLLSSSSIAQDTISVDYATQFTSTFTIQDGRITGEGAKLLRKDFDDAQFVLLGETHGDAQISMLTAALIPELGARGYKNFIIETGPHSANILKRICSNNVNTLKVLHDFYTRYYKKLGDIPIPFFEGIEDAVFLQSALQSRMNIVGIDQEYYSSSLLLFEELLKLDSNANSLKLFDKAVKELTAHHQLDLKEKNYPLHRNLLNTIEIEEYFKSLNTSNADIKSIIDALTFSWKVYALYTEDRKQNLTLRAKYMRDNFARHYQKQQSEDLESQKYLIKLGSWHTMRGLTYNGVHDIGSLVHDMARENGTNDLNISFLFRYFQDDEEELGYFDNSEGNSKWLRERRPIMKQGERNEWSLVDLRRIKSQADEGKILLYPTLQKMTEQFDIILIPPITFDVTLNYDE